jgi:hypothetical protein
VFQVHGNLRHQKGNPFTKYSYVLKVFFDRMKPFAIEIIPFQITNSHRPKPLYGKGKEEFLNHLQKITHGIKDPVEVLQAWKKICRYNYTTHWKWMKWEFKHKGWRWIPFHLKILLGRNTHRKWIFGFFSAWLTSFTIYIQKSLNSKLSKLKLRISFWPTDR